VLDGDAARSLTAPARACAAALVLVCGAASCSSSDPAADGTDAPREAPAASAPSEDRTEPDPAPDPAPDAATDTDADIDATTSSTVQDGATWRTSAVGALPEGFPGDVPLPPQHRVVVATESLTAQPKSFVLQLAVSGTPAAVFDAIGAAFDAGGWEELQRSTGDSKGSATGTAVYRKEATLVNLGAIPGGQPDSTALTYSIVPTAPVLGPEP
jgi:hypothetical protein